MKKTLEITLRSDLCAGVGKHYASMIDLDTAIDDCGFPYIPSRRLKDCMREIAEYFVDDNTIDELFGKRGHHKPGSLNIENAVVFSNYDEYYDAVDALRQKKIIHYEVTDLFCSTRDRTSVNENGTAEDGSLRFTRVVNRLAPDMTGNMKFYAAVEYDDGYDEIVGNLCKGLRNIGYERNRGLGSVECRLLPDAMRKRLEKPDVEFDDDKEYKLDYLVRLDGDLMLPGTDSNHSMDYIPGTMALGAFAGKYSGNSFNQVFLSDKVRFSNLYISDREGNEYIPAPRFFAKIKAANEDERGIFNILGVDVAKPKPLDDTPVQYKPLKKGYINSGYGYLEPLTKIVYHNAINTDDPGLYMQYCLCGQQYYRGAVTAFGAVMRELYPLFSEKMSFGRSKNAQYASCSAVKLSVDRYVPSHVTSERGSTIAFVLKSDAIITDENGICTVSAYALLQKLIEASGIKVDDIVAFDMSDDCMNKTSLASKVISGYNAKWNLKKPQVTAISAGSALVVRCNRDLRLAKEFFIGEKTNEGFGHIIVFSHADCLSACEVEKRQMEKSHKKNQIIDLALMQREEAELLMKAVNTARDNVSGKSFSLNKSQISRVLLMCRESDTLDDFLSRVDSIKTRSTKSEFQKYFSETVVKNAIGDLSNWQLVRYYIINELTVMKYLCRKEDD